MCSFASSGGVCPFGDDCQLAHNNVEYYFHPALFKTQICHNASCVTPFCPNLHRGEEVRDGRPFAAPKTPPPQFAPLEPHFSVEHPPPPQPLAFLVSSEPALPQSMRAKVHSGELQRSPLMFGVAGPQQQALPQNSSAYQLQLASTMNAVPSCPKEGELD